MIVGLGIDVVAVDRMAGLLERYPGRAPERLFTPAERALCSRRPDAAECFAARFAAKEALLKALGTGLGGGIAWRDVEVRVDGRGRPRLELSGRARERLREVGGGRLHLTFTHDAGAAVAVVVVEAPGQGGA